MSDFDRVDLSALRHCDVLAVHARPGIARPGDRLECSAGHERVADKTGRWTRTYAASMSR